MVKSNSPQTHELFNLNTATSNVAVIPPTLHEAFSLAGVYSDNVALSSYANFAWQNTWWPNTFLSNPAMRALAPTATLNESSLTNTLTLSNQPQNSITSTTANNNAAINTNGSSSTLPLTQHLNLGAYNNYLAPNFGSLLNPATPTTTSTSAIQMPSSLVTNISSTSSMLSSLGSINDTFAPSSLNTTSQQAVGGRMRSIPKSPRYSVSRGMPNNRSCECPNCVELAQRGLSVDKKNEKHSCHIPGCMKIYGKSSHLKAHLRWHNTSRQTVTNRLNHAITQQQD